VLPVVADAARVALGDLDAAQTAALRAQLEGIRGRSAATLGLARLPLDAAPRTHD